MVGLTASNGPIRSSDEGRGSAARPEPQPSADLEFEALSASIRAIRDAVRTLLDEIDPGSASAGGSGD